MANRSTVGRALRFGIAAELLLCGISGVSTVVYYVCGGLRGPTGYPYGFVRLIHKPGFWFSGLLVDANSPMYLPVCLISTALLLSLLAYVVLRFCYEKKSAPSG